MKETPTDQIYKSLISAYSHFNRELFSGDLPPVLIVLQRQAKTMGYVSPKRWRSASGEYTDELAVNPEYFLGYPLLEVLQTLVHESCHIWQHHFGNPGRRGYHNKQWANKMEEVGLMPSRTGKPGGKKTGEHVMDYAVVDGRFYEASIKLLDTGFALPWLDLWPKPNYDYKHAVYNKNGETVSCAGTADQAALIVPLGASVKPIESQELNTPEEDLAEGATYETPSLPGVRISVNLEPVPHPAKKPTRVKYTCSCRNNVWGKPGLKLICGECKKEYQQSNGK